MTPTLAGRIQSRLVLLISVGVPWTFIVAPLLATVADMTYADAMRLGIRAVVVAALAGVVWEPLYHGLQQFRWEKDWPTLFGLLTGVPEGFVVLVLLDRGVAGELGDIPVDAYFVHFATVWLLVWGISNGPLAILVPRWRFRGGRFW